MTIVFEMPMSDEFEEFFANRLGWFGHDIDHYDYTETFIEHAQLNRKALDAVELYPLSVSPSASDPTVARFQLPGFEAGETEYRDVDLKATDAEQRVTQLEAQAREVSAIELFRQLVTEPP